MGTSRLMWLVMWALLAWGTWIAAGAWQHNRGQIKFLIIAGFVMAFLGGWWMLWQLRERRMARKATDPSP